MSDEMRFIAQGVGVERRGRKVLCGVDLDVVVPGAAESGDFVVVCARDADAGLALLRVLAGLQAPDEGSVRYLGGNVYEAGQSLKQKLGYVPAGDLVPGSLKVERALGYAGELRLWELEPEVRVARVDEVMGALGLGEVGGVRVDRLDFSGGMRVKLAVERLGGARVMMVDGLGVGCGVWVVLGEVLRGVSGMGVSVVCVVGMVGEDLARAFGDVVYVLEEGRLGRLV